MRRVKLECTGGQGQGQAQPDFSLCRSTATNAIQRQTTANAHLLSKWLLLVAFTAQINRQYFPVAVHELTDDMSYW